MSGKLSELTKTIKLNKCQTRQFLKILSNPPKPNEALRKAVEEYKRKVAKGVWETD